ncbi:MAG TPA: DNA-3-methyladenine glycosylase I [Thermomicrobiales bacterium]|nr:DNA-3-methyladenine glycosylase I [Thermomicrobiales bacterium]
MGADEQMAAAGPVHENGVAATRGVAIGDDGLARCPWATSPPLYVDYHDTEWGMPVRGEQPIFERIMLEAFQAGLSWLTILTRRPAFRAAFADFDPDIVARFSDADIERLMQDASIIRNRQKILAARTNARAVVALREQGGLDELIWSRQPPVTPIPRTLADVPAQTPASKALSKELKAHGFVFVGPTTVHALMEAIGMVDTHLVDCHRRGCSGLFAEDGVTAR